MFLRYALRIFPQSHAGQVQKPLFLQVLRRLLEVLEEVLDRCFSVRDVRELRLGAGWKYGAVNIVMRHPIFHLALTEIGDSQNLLQGQRLVFEAQRNGEFLGDLKVLDGGFHVSQEGI